jgi:hypothetical protein
MGKVMNTETGGKIKDSSGPDITNTLKKTEKIDYNQQLKNEFGQLIDQLQLEDIQKAYLRSRWLDQLLWMEGRANYNRNWHRRLRFTSIVLGVIVPVLVTLDVGNIKLFNQFDSQKALKGATIVLSSIIAISAALEGFYQFGNRWYSYRKSTELLKTNGWQFFQRSGQYRNKSHQEAFPTFIEQVESIVQRDVEIFVTEGIKEKLKEPEEQTPNENLQDTDKSP